MKKLVFLAIVMVMALVLALPVTSTVAQTEPVEVKVWVAFDDYRLDWVQRSCCQV